MREETSDLGFLERRLGSTTIHVSSIRVSGRRMSGRLASGIEASSSSVSSSFVASSVVSSLSVLGDWFSSCVISGECSNSTCVGRSRWVHGWAVVHNVSVVRYSSVHTDTRSWVFRLLWYVD
jgi:hypothetical protein